MTWATLPPPHAQGFSQHDWARQLEKQPMKQDVKLPEILKPWGKNPLGGGGGRENGNFEIYSSYFNIKPKLILLF